MYHKIPRGAYRTFASSVNHIASAYASSRHGHEPHGFQQLGEGMAAALKSSHIINEAGIIMAAAFDIIVGADITTLRARRGDRAPSACYWREGISGGEPPASFIDIVGHNKLKNMRKAAARSGAPAVIAIKAAMSLFSSMVAYFARVIKPK